MAAYPTEGGFLTDQGEIDFNFEPDEVFLVVMTEWGGKCASKFLLAPDAETAVKLAAPQHPPAVANVSYCAASWSSLIERKREFERERNRKN
jgi:hypothetical protein